ncbi:hypothetical protein NQ317_004753 [Molorchus minor]|uniref:Uncharacterized protein n=1 Tax=Molorchus minor TaxID=1323400 RepID=A0ABQ9JEP1_9CUCU|nr:hypothetical protein NQ317_004753 [Molorchus minor]
MSRKMYKYIVGEKWLMELNACGDGPIRTTQEWKKKKAREQKELNANEQKKLLSLTGTVAVTGFQQITEIGAVVEPQDEPLEVLIVEVENDADDMPCSSKKGKRNKKLIIHC